MGANECFKAIQTFEMIIVTRVKLEGSDSTVCAVPSSYNRPSANYFGDVMPYSTK